MSILTRPEEELHWTKVDYLPRCRLSKTSDSFPVLALKTKINQLPSEVEQLNRKMYLAALKFTLVGDDDLHPRSLFKILSL